MQVPKEIKHLSEDDMRSFFELGPDLLCIIGQDGRFQYANQKWSNVLGYEIDQIIGEEYLNLVHPDDIAATLKERELTLKRKNPKSFANRYRKKNGDYVWLEWRSYFDPDKNLFYCIVRDITEIKKLEQSADQLDASLDMNDTLDSIRLMVKEMSDDITEPLFQAQAHLDVLHELIQSPQIDEKYLYKEHLDHINQALKSISHNFKGLNHLTSIQSSDSLPHLFTLLENIQFANRGRLKKHGLTLVTPSVDPSIVLECESNIFYKTIYQILSLIKDGHKKLSSKTHQESPIHLELDKSVSKVQLILEYQGKLDLDSSHKAISNLQKSLNQHKASLEMTKSDNWYRFILTFYYR